VHCSRGPARSHPVRTTPSRAHTILPRAYGALYPPEVGGAPHAICAPAPPYAPPLPSYARADPAVPYKVKTFKGLTGLITYGPACRGGGDWLGGPPGGDGVPGRPGPGGLCALGPAGRVSCGDGPHTSRAGDSSSYGGGQHTSSAGGPSLLGRSTAAGASRGPGSTRGCAHGWASRAWSVSACSLPSLPCWPPARPCDLAVGSRAGSGERARCSTTVTTCLRLCPCMGLTSSGHPWAGPGPYGLVWA
jgi:hypothetical protein